MSRLLKKDMVSVLVNEAVNPNWRGHKADDERTAWEKELRKKTWKELKAYYDAVNKREMDCLFQ